MSTVIRTLAASPLGPSAKVQIAHLWSQLPPHIREPLLSILGRIVAQQWDAGREKKEVAYDEVQRS